MRDGERSAEDSWWASGLVFRAACSLLGAVCGLVLALLIAVAWATTGKEFAQMQSLLAIGALAGAAGAGLAPEALLKAVTGLSYFLVALLSAWGGDDPPQAPQNDGWLKACAIFGAVYALMLTALWILWR